MIPLDVRRLRRRLGAFIGPALFRVGMLGTRWSARLTNRFAWHAFPVNLDWQPPSGGVWVDVGANHGGVVARAPQGVRMFAFEPNIALASTLEHRFPHATIIAAAVSDFDGVAVFHHNSDDATSSLLPIDEAALQAYEGIEPFRTVRTSIVPVVRLDTMLREAGIAHVDYLSVDAQGADLAVLRSLGDRIADVDHITVEAWTKPAQYVGAENTAAAVRAYLVEHGFREVGSADIVFGQALDITFTRHPQSPGARS